LKQNQLGRATCILLENIQDQAMYMARPFHVPENTVRLFDLVKVSKEEVKSAFFYAYSNTLYCENLDQALAVSTGENNNRRRVIARKGHNFALYEMNGTINSVPARRGGFQKKAAQNRKNNEAEDRELVQRH
jgi:chromosome segregation ATPase